VAALAGRHFELAQVLHRYKSSVEPWGYFENTPLHSAAAYGNLEMVQVLLEYGVDANAQNRFRRTPLDFTLPGGHYNRLRV
jgi:ankyrin repeat protein